VTHELHERARVTRLRSGDVELAQQRGRERVLPIYSTQEYPLHRRIGLDAPHRAADQRDAAHPDEEIRKRGTSTQAATAIVVVGIDRYHAAHARVAPGAEQQGDRATDRLAGQHGALDVQLVQDSRHGRDEELRRVIRARRVRVAMPRVVQGVDPEARGQLRNDLLEHVELRAQRVQQHEGRSGPRDQVADPHAIHGNVADRDVRPPWERRRTADIRRGKSVGHRNLLLLPADLRPQRTKASRTEARLLSASHPSDGCWRSSFGRLDEATQSSHRPVLPLSVTYAGKRICFRRLLSNADSGTKRRSKLTWRAVRPAA